MKNYCDRCADPLPLDGNCDCLLDPDRDRTADGLHTHKVLTISGLKRAILPQNVTEIDRCKRREL